MQIHAPEPVLRGSNSSLLVQLYELGSPRPACEPDRMRTMQALGLAEPTPAEPEVTDKGV